MTTADLEPTVGAILADEWGDRRSWFDFALGSPACHVVVAEAAGDVVGTGVATVNGPVAWIGTIWVAPAHRRHGLGRALTQGVIDAAATAGARTLVLVSTDRGRPLYEGLGFDVQSWYRTFEAPALPSGGVAPDGRIRAFRSMDLDGMLALDRFATGEDRATVIGALATPSGTRVLESADGDVRGFLARAPWGGGATVAPNADDALAILRARRMSTPPGRRVRCGILLENQRGAEALQRDGWTEAWRAPRLVRGASMVWHPEHLWGQFNHAMG
jgi:GNAT superfamily N-acetyltransferase